MTATQFVGVVVLLAGAIWGIAGLLGWLSRRGRGRQDEE